MNKAHSCTVYKKCGGCQLTNLSYQEQLSYKMKTEIALLGKFCRVEEIIGMDNSCHYRNKMQAAFSTDRGGHPISGVWQTKERKIVKTDSCAIEDEMSSWIVRAARGMLKEYGISVFNRKSGKGNLKHIMVRHAMNTDEIMVVLVTGNTYLKRGREFAKMLVHRYPQIRTVVQCVNDTDLPLWIGEKTIILYGEGYIEDKLCDCIFRISPQSFYQINSAQTEKLYSIAVDYANLKANQIAVDAYAGIGTIGIIAAKKSGAHIFGVENNDFAVRNAFENCRLNNTKNYRIVKSDSGEYMEKLANEKKKTDVVFTDPPRAGCSRKFLNSVVKLAPEKIVYISCNPETLARDLQFLTHNKYKVLKIQPLDLFPHTRHVETVVLLCKHGFN